MTSSMPIKGKEPVTKVPLDEGNNKNAINNGNKTVNTPTPTGYDVEFDIPNVYKCQCKVLGKKIITLSIVKKYNLIWTPVTMMYQLPQW